MQQLNESITAGEGGMGQGSSLRREQKRSQKPSKGLLETRETVSIATMKTEHAVLMNVGGHKISSLLVFLSPWRQGKTSNRSQANQLLIMYNQTTQPSVTNKHIVLFSCTTRYTLYISHSQCATLPPPPSLFLSLPPLSPLPLQDHPQQPHPVVVEVWKEMRSKRKRKRRRRRKG